jgi:hypothetical protein
MKTIDSENCLLLWVYDDDYTPYIINNPPENLEALLREWNALDKILSDTGEEPEGWDYVDTWLADKGVDIFFPSKELNVSSFMAYDEGELTGAK